MIACLLPRDGFNELCTKRDNNLSIKLIGKRRGCVASTCILLYLVPLIKEKGFEEIDEHGLHRFRWNVDEGQGM
jgi:hypothetical protein